VRQGRSEQFLTHRYRAGELSRAPDDLIVEEPMSIQLDGFEVATTMRTPGNDFELAAGFLHSEGLLGEASVQTVRYCATGSALTTEYNVVTVETGGEAPIPTPRLQTTNSSCGLCGSQSLEELTARLNRYERRDPFPLDVLVRSPELVRSEQALFAATGAVHGAAVVCVDGTVEVVREDIGRHNAVDKVVGRLLLDDRLPASDSALFVSGRASFEIVQKAWAAGFSAVVAVSAPSALAVDTARAAGILLTGFTRDGSMNIYSPANL
jgi:FdhD protein